MGCGCGGSGAKKEQRAAPPGKPAAGAKSAEGGPLAQPGFYWEGPKRTAKDKR